MIPGKIISKKNAARDIIEFSVLLGNSVMMPSFSLSSFNYVPGQYVVITFDKGSKERRSYSILDFKNNVLRLLIKISGEFTKKLSETPEGTDILVYGPHGKFTFKGEKSVMIAGGIGIVPLYAIFNDALSQGKEVHMHYSARTPEDMALKDELEGKENVKLYFTGTDNGQRFKLDSLQERFFDGTYDFYVCGPERMMSDMIESLNKKNKDIKIYTESFVL